MDEPAETDLFGEPTPAALAPGERLRQAREAAGMSLDQVAAETRIPQRHLQLIEAGDFGALPARTYAIGFSRSFAKAVGLDEREIVGEVRTELARLEPTPVSRATPFEPGDPARIPGSTVIWIATAAVFALLVIGYFGYSSMFAPAAELPSLLPDDQPTAQADAPKPSPSPSAANDGPVVFTATSPGVWVRFYDANGTQLLQKELALGETYTVPPNVDGPQLRTARPDALKITIGGREVPPLATRQQLIKDVPVSAAALLARPSPTPTQTSAPASPATQAQTRATAPTPVATPTARPQPQPTRAAPRPAQSPDRSPVESAIEAAIGGAPTD